VDEQSNNDSLRPIIMYLKDGKLPDKEDVTKKVVTEASLYTVVDNILYIPVHGNIKVPCWAITTISARQSGTAGSDN